MRFNWLQPFISADESRAERSMPEEELPEIVEGAFAAWARTEMDRDRRSLEVGGVCRMPDGREGRLVELAEGGQVTFLCRPT